MTAICHPSNQWRQRLLLSTPMQALQLTFLFWSGLKLRSLFHSLFLSNFKNIVSLSLSLSKRKKQQNILDQETMQQLFLLNWSYSFFSRSIVRSAFLLKKKKKHLELMFCFLMECLSSGYSYKNRLGLKCI
jgi:hypothetical protein